MSTASADRGAPGRRHCAQALRLAAGVLACGVLLVTLGCAKPTRIIANDLLMPLRSPARWGPEPSDLAAAQLAEAALANQRAEVATTLARVESIHDSHTTKGLSGLCQDLANSTLDDPIAYREASKQLKKRKGVDHGLKARLDQSIRNDTLQLASRRRRDTWERLWARTFNAVSEPLGRALLTGAVTAPFTIAQSSAHYLASFSNDEPISSTHRQALVLHKQYLAEHPNAENADKIRRKIDKSQADLEKTLRKRYLRAAKRYLSQGQYQAAALSADRAMLHGGGRKARRILDEAEIGIARRDRLRAISVEADPNPASDPASEDAIRLSTALLASSGEPLSLRRLRSLDIDRDGPEGDELEFAEAVALIESGYEDRGRERLEAIANDDPRLDPMARHAATLLGNTREDPYLAFERLKRSQRWALVRYRFFAEWSEGTRYPNLPKSVAYAIESPGVAQTFATTPIRLIFGAWNDHPDFSKPTAVAAYRYLGLEPDGEHRRDVLEWLVDYEEKRGNAVVALRNADFLPDFDPERRLALLGKASQQALKSAGNIRRVEDQNRVLREVAREFPDSEAGHEAGELVREQVLTHSSQRIRITKSFLIENPRVAGDEALGLRPELLNDRVQDGELHPDGVIFLGGQRMLFLLVAETGDEDDPPVEVYRTISERRIGRTAAMLDTTVRTNELIDPDERLGPDGDRDQFIERAALGLVDEPDERPTARSTYVYRSMRERYGMVRGRESVLPVDLVFQGSFTDFSLAAFPRWRPPKETPDAFLYR